MLKSRSKFFLHARVRRIDADEVEFDDAQAGHPIERRLNRLERVSAAYRGQISLRFNNGMLVTFESADAALLGACEMQHRCAVLPQVSRQKLALCIGIHQGVVKQRAKDGADDTRELAAQLARTNDAILISQAMVDGLNQDLRKLARPLAEKVSGLAVFTIDWRRRNSFRRLRRGIVLADLDALAADQPLPVSAFRTEDTGNLGNQPGCNHWPRPR